MSSEIIVEHARESFCKDFFRVMQKVFLEEFRLPLVRCCNQDRSASIKQILCMYQLATKNDLLNSGHIVQFLIDIRILFMVYHRVVLSAVL